MDASGRANFDSGGRPVEVVVGRDIEIDGQRIVGVAGIAGLQIRDLRTSAAWRAAACSRRCLSSDCWACGAWRKRRIISVSPRAAVLTWAVSLPVSSTLPTTLVRSKASKGKLGRRPHQLGVAVGRNSQRLLVAQRARTTCGTARRPACCPARSLCRRPARA